MPPKRFVKASGHSSSKPTAVDSPEQQEKGPVFDTSVIDIAILVAQLTTSRRILDGFFLALQQALDPANPKNHSAIEAMRLLYTEMAARITEMQTVVFCHAERHTRLEWYQIVHDLVVWTADTMKSVVV